LIIVSPPLIIGDTAVVGVAAACVPAVAPVYDIDVAAAAASGFVHVLLPAEALTPATPYGL
jgi:hypothetical protein